MAALLVHHRVRGRARDFAASTDLRQAMAGAGVVDRPSVVFLQESARIPV